MLNSNHLDSSIIFTTIFCIQTGGACMYNISSYLHSFSGTDNNLRQGFLSHPILYLSKYIINNKESYYHYLNGVSSRGDWKRWLLYMLTAFAVIEAIFTQPYIKAIHLVNDKIKGRNTARRYLDQLCNIQVLELKHIDNENVYINNDLVRILETT